MTVAFVSASAWFDGATGLTADKVLTLPSHSTGNIVLVLAAWKDYAITAQISGYTEITEFADGSTATGNGSGSMKVGAWYKVAASGAESNPTLDFSTTTGLVGEACVLVFSQSAGTWSTPTFATAAWPSQASGTAISSSSVAVPSAGALVGLVGIRDDTATLSRGPDGVYATNGFVTYSGDHVEAPATHASTVTGNDMAADAGYRLVTAGIASTTLRFAISSMSAAETGAVLWVILGDEAPAGNVTVTPTTAALVITENIPTVTVSNNQVVTPTTKALTSATFAPTVTTAAATYPQLIVSHGPVGYWRMGEASGSVLDSIGSNHGTATGTTRDVTGALAANDDGAITFNGTSDKVRMGDVLDQTGAVTYELWIKRSNTTSATQYLMNKGAGQPNISLTTSHQIAVGEENVTLVVGSTVLNNTNWHHIVFTWTGAAAVGAAKVYVDGVDVGVHQFTATIAGSTSSLSLGAAYVDALWFAGTIDEAAIYNSVLTAAQVLAHYNKAISGPQLVTPTTATLTVTRYAPGITLSNHQRVTPTTAAVVLTKYVPTVTATADVAVIPGTAAITTTKYAPTVTAHQHVTVTPTTRALSDTQFAPTVTVSNHQRVTPITKALTATTYAPAARTPALVTPTTKPLALVKFAPTVTTPQRVTPTTKALTTSSFAPTVTNPQRYVPTTAALTATKYAPTVTVSAASTIVVPNAQLAVERFAPTVTASNKQIATPATAAITTTKYTPTIRTPQTVTPATKAITVTRYVPVVDVSSAQAIVPATKALTITRYAPGVSATAHVAVTPSTKVLQLTGFAPAARVANLVRPATKAVVLTTLAPIVTPTLNVLLRPNPNALTITRYPAILGASGHQYPEPLPATLTTTGLAPSVEVHSVTPLPDLIYGFAIVAVGDSSRVGTAQGGATVRMSEGGSTAVSVSGPSARVTIR